MEGTSTQASHHHYLICEKLVQQDTHLQGHVTTTRQMDGVNGEEGLPLTPVYDSWKGKQFC